MNKINKTTTILLATASALVGALGIYAFVYTTVAEVHAQLIAAHVEYDAEMIEREHQNEILTLAEETSEMQRELASYLLVADDPIEFLNLFEDIGREAGVMLEVESLSKEEVVMEKGKSEEEPKDPRVQVVVRVEGAWSNVYHLLTLLETMPYALSIDRVHVSEGELETGYGWSGQVHLSINTKK